MATFTVEGVIDAPAALVFDYRLQITNLPKYNPDVRELREVANAAKPTYEFRIRLMPGFSARCSLVVESVTPHSEIVFAIASMFPAREICSFEEVPSSSGVATRVRFANSVDLPEGFWGRVLESLFVRRAARKQMTRELKLMKAHIERRDLLAS